jgi:cation transport ATPase
VLETQEHFSVRGNDDLPSECGRACASLDQMRSISKTEKRNETIMSRWLSALLAWCFVFLLAIEHTATKSARHRSRAVHVVLMLATVIAFAISMQVIAADALTVGARVRVQLIGGDADWHAGQVRTIEDCRMVFLTKPTRDGYTALMLNGASRLQASKAMQWQDVSLRDLLQAEPPKCREVGAD